MNTQNDANQLRFLAMRCDRRADDARSLAACLSKFGGDSEMIDGLIADIERRSEFFIRVQSMLDRRAAALFPNCEARPADLCRTRHERLLLEAAVRAHQIEDSVVPRKDDRDGQGD